MLADYLQALQSKRNVSNEKIAENAPVSTATYSRMRSGANPNPEINSLVGVMKYLGGSIDEVYGLKPVGAFEMEKENEKLKKENEELRKHLADKTALVSALEASVKNHREVIDTRRTLFEKQAEDLSRHADDLRDQLKVAHAEVDRVHKVDFWLSIGAVLVMLIAMYFVIDALSPAWGLIQY